MSNLPASQRQGYLGELGSKPSCELRDLLSRQHSMIANVKFVRSLPDQGEKIQRTMEKLESILRQREHIDDTADLFEKMALEAEHLSKARTQTTVTEGRESQYLRQIINVEIKDKVVMDERGVPEGEPRDDNINSYHQVIKKADGKVLKKEKYYPHRSVRTKDLEDLPANITNSPLKKEKSGGSTVHTDAMDAVQESELPGNSGRPVCKDTRAHAHQKRPVDPSSRLKFRYDECLERAVSEGQKAHDSVKLISVEHSMELMLQQKNKMEELQAKQAAEKLSQRLGVSMATFDPEGCRKMAYRDTGQHSDSDGADSDQDLEYPD